MTRCVCYSGLARPVDIRYQIDLLALFDQLLSPFDKVHRLHARGVKLSWGASSAATRDKNFITTISNLVFVARKKIKG